LTGIATQEEITSPTTSRRCEKDFISSVKLNPEKNTPCFDPLGAIRFIAQ
jgi:hypothetical protein